MWQPTALRVVRAASRALIAENFRKDFVCGRAHDLQLLWIECVLHDYDLRTDRQIGTDRDRQGDRNRQGQTQCAVSDSVQRSARVHEEAHAIAVENPRRPLDLVRLAELKAVDAVVFAEMLAKGEDAGVIPASALHRESPVVRICLALVGALVEHPGEHYAVLVYRLVDLRRFVPADPWPSLASAGEHPLSNMRRGWWLHLRDEARHGVRLMLVHVLQTELGHRAGSLRGELRHL